MHEITIPALIDTIIGVQALPHVLILVRPLDKHTIARDAVCCNVSLAANSFLVAGEGKGGRLRLWHRVTAMLLCYAPA